MKQQLLPEASWEQLLSRLSSAVPEAFDSSGKALNLTEGKWQSPGRPKALFSCVDGSRLGDLPQLSSETVERAVLHAQQSFSVWKNVDREVRKAHALAFIEAIEQHRSLLAYLMVWEIGKPYYQSLEDVDRCTQGGRWYLDHLDEMLEGRTPLGVVSNINSWNYPMSMLVLSSVIQVLCGNVVIAKTPSSGGMFALTLSFALAHRHDLPVSLVSGAGQELGEVLIQHPAIDCVSFVGGKKNGRHVAAALTGTNKRYMLEMEGINSYGIWNFSDWQRLKPQIRYAFKYGKQRCTAYVRYVIQRRLFPAFLDLYLETIQEVQVGHPLVVSAGETEPPRLDYGPLISAQKAQEVNLNWEDALRKGAIPLFEGQLNSDRFLPGQDLSAYVAPATLLHLPRNASLYHQEPFGPVDSIMLVDSQEELIHEMNVSNGALVSSIACDNPVEAEQIAQQLRSFKVGINQIRTRGDKEDTFGGLGESWKGSFVGGKYSILAVSQGPKGESLYGNFPNHMVLPERGQLLQL